MISWASKPRQPSPMQEPANNLSSHALPFSWMPLHENLFKDNNITFTRDWPMSQNTFNTSLHQVCAWTREAERQNNWTPIPYRTSTRTSGQTMRLQGLNWRFYLEWIQTNCKNSKSMQTSCHAFKSWQNRLLLRCSCISKLGPSPHAVKHRSCGATTVMRATLNINFLTDLQNWGVKSQE